MDTSKKLMVGTSGWCYKHWGHGTFYPDGLNQKNWLSFYSERFLTVEINNTFYNTPKEHVFTKWRDTVPRGFIFSVKMNKFVTHNVKLKDPALHLERFFKPCSALGDKLGPILFQFGGSFSIKPERLKVALEYIKRQPYVKEPKLVFEFRNLDNLTDEVIAMLKAHNAALCFSDYPGAVTTGPVTADLIYIRRHGPADTYSSRYDRNRLEEDAACIRNWLQKGKDVYVYFNNDVDGFAVQNAAELLNLLAA
jgi:uncharacterized protein YecE (DUF72 family)